MSSPVRIPADVEMPDKVLGPFTLRQVTLLAAAGLLLAGGWQATHSVLPAPVFLAMAAPIAAATTALVLTRRDGVPLDALLVAAIRHRLAPRRRVATGEPPPPPPEWLTSAVTDPHTRRGRTAVKTGALRLPAEQITDSGVIDLGPDGLAAIAVCGTVNFTLRTPDEQAALIAAFGSWLHSLTTPAQLLVRTNRLDLSKQITELRETAGGLPHPALERAATAHADFLADLDARSDLLRRQVLLVIREDLRPPSSPAGLLASLTGRRRAHRPGATAVASREGAETRLLGRLSEAASLLGAAGITLTPLDAREATTVLAAACDPDTLLPPGTPLAASGDVITSPTHPDAEDDDPPTADAATAAHPQPAGASAGFRFDYQTAERHHEVVDQPITTAEERPSR